MAAACRPPRVRRLSIKENSHTEATTATPQAAGAGVSLLVPGAVVGAAPTTTPSTAATAGSSPGPGAADPSLRVSTILKRWNSHRERRLSDSRATPDSTAAPDTPPCSRKLSSW